jgi:DNA-binding MarR family transcriptional regulator
VTSTPQLPEVLDRRVTYLLGRVAGAVGRRANSALTTLGIDTRHYSVLAAVEAGDGLSQRAVADLLGIDRATVVALTDDLERDGLLRRGRSPRDRRAYALRLTAEGSRITQAAHALMDDCEHAFLGPLPGPQQAELAGLLQQLLPTAAPPAG